MSEGGKKYEQAIPRLESPHIKLRIKRVDALRTRHRLTYFSARSALLTMDERPPLHGEQRNKKLHVVVAVKLKGIQEIFVAENNSEHHAERQLVQTLIKLKRKYDAKKQPFPRIQSLSLIARHPEENTADAHLPKTLSIDTLPHGTPCMCEKCVRLFRRLLKFLYPEPARASEDTDALFEKRHSRWLKTRNFPMLIGIGGEDSGLAIKTNFHTAPIIPFPGSQSAKTVQEVLKEH